ncbi:putative kinesin [Leptomonas pyrrhocoris]|uniref:Putative kinesin n=1 Tax=Leptomonas pyrrhocoris TaxID=157538 RepID=A0A0M9FZR6_LEPPY|nr:putative kinesin [Leptomonas pyrrhocoris]XP_015657655.1 putative kinesin [Leptomonas pyrrhocoris]KPA79215.1 putative kinesin [Leptomonas pyrrhocoris]KPA79216.1 putative kinesin [Leptomonas pyrrhocoris]|eukprot:XP_015657654.1 putative kinesin [Leptomonas pyrrhocoris]
MKATTSLRQKVVNRSGADKPTGNGRRPAADTAANNGRSDGANRSASAGRTGGTPSLSRRRGLSAGSSSDSRTTGKTQQKSPNSHSPHGTTATKSVTPRSGVSTSSPPPKLLLTIPRLRPGAPRPALADHSDSSRPRDSPTPALVGAAATGTFPKSRVSAGAGTGLQRHSIPADPRQVMQRQPGSLSTSFKACSTVGATSPSGTTGPILNLKDEANTKATLQVTPATASTRNVVSGSLAKPMLSTSHVIVEKDGVARTEAAANTTASSAPTPVPQKDADDIDMLDMGLALRLGDLPSVPAAADPATFQVEQAPPYVAGTPPFRGMRRRSSVWSSEKTTRSQVISGSGATLPPAATSRRQTLDSDDGVVLRSAEAVGAADATSSAFAANAVAAVSPTKTPSTASNSPVKLVSAHLVSSSTSTAKVGSAPTNRRRRRSTENTGALRQTGKSPNAKTNVGKASAAPTLQKTHDMDQQVSASSEKNLQRKSSDSGAASGLPSSSHSPAKTEAAGTALAAGGPASSSRTPQKSAPPRPASKTSEGHLNHKQRSGTPSNANVNTPTTTASYPSTPRTQNAPQTTLRNPRAAAMLSQMLSVVRPMAPVVHVRIRPVLPSFGETTRQRHVYLLDHENVMITGTRFGFGGKSAATSAAAGNSLLFPTTDYVAAKHIGADTRGGSSGGTGRSHEGFLSTGSSVVMANSANGGWQDRKGALSPRRGIAAVASGSAGEDGAGSLISPIAAPLCDGIPALLMSPSENPPPLHDIAHPAALAETKRRQSRSSSNATLGSARLQSLLIPGAIPSVGASHHPRTTSWLSQGSEDVAVGSRLSYGSHSTSPPQSGLPPGGGSASLMSAVSTPRARPRLAAFTALPEDTTLSPATTPRGLTAGNPAAGAVEENRGRGGRRTSALMQLSVSLSAMTAPGSRATTRKNSMVSGSSLAGPQKSGRAAANGERRLTARSALGASVSVSAVSTLTLTKLELKSPAAVEERRRSRSPPQRDLLTGNSTFADAPPDVAAATNTNTPRTNGTEQHYRFEFVHDEEATQADVFEESVLRFADEALLAQNVAIICYGPTGSGKTYSMMGSQAQASSTGAATAGGGGVASKSSSKSFNAHGNAAKSGNKMVNGHHTPLKTASSDNARSTSVAEGKRRLADDSIASGGARADSTSRRDPSVGLVMDDEDDEEGNTWPQLGSSWQCGYTDRFTKSAATAKESLADAEGDGGDGWHRHSHAAVRTAGNMMTSASMMEMGILPRLVHTLLERRGEAITIRRESGGGRDNGGGGGGGASATAGSTSNSPQPTPRPASASKATSLSLTLRDLTFYGIELYMDHLCDLLDPGKRPIQTVSDTGGLEALCQRINEARDYRINGIRGGASQVCVTSPRAGGGMPITSLADLRRAYRLAHDNRVTSRHAQNDTSSRSHAIFLLQLDFDLVESRVEAAQKQQQRRHDATAGTATEDTAETPAETVQRVHSYVAMVDLAGCERVKQTKVEGVALREAQYINKSLSALSSVVLSLHRNNAHVPYRDSKLTRLLRPCLEGGRVLTLVHVAPCSSTETVNTLKFADQIRHTHIPTHALTPTSSKHRELLDVFADLIDPMQGLWEAQVRHAQSQLSRLCADTRLAYFSRAMGAVSRHGPTDHGLSSRSVPSDTVSEVSALTDVDDSTSLSPGDVSLEEGPPPLTCDATEKERRGFALHSLLHRLMGPIHQHQRTSMRDAIRDIRRRKEHKIASYELQLQQRIEKLQSTVEKLTATNARLASENSTPLPRDPYALELNRQLRDTSEQINEATKEQAALSTLSAALRQRLVNQDMLETTVDEQLRKVQHRTAQALQTLSAAAAAHPPGVMPSPPAVILSNLSSPREPTLPTGSLVPAVMAMETDDDPELRDIAHQQISLAKELAALRLEAACFEIGTGVWEGLWTRAMRKEIVTALEVEVFAMERILLDRRALSLMLMDDKDGDEEDGDEAGTAGRFAEAFLTLPRAAASGKERQGRGHAAVTGQSSLVPTSMARLPNKTTPPGNRAASMRSALWVRLGTYLHGRGHQDNAVETPSHEQMAAAAIAGKTTTAAAAAARDTDGQTGSPRTPPPPPPLLSSSSSSPWRRDRTHATVKSNSEASEPRSSEGQRTRGGGALFSRTGSPLSRAPQRLPEEVVVNPLTILAMAHDEAMRQRPQSPPPPLQEQDPQTAFTPPPSPRRSEAAPSTAIVAAALLPLTISGTYGDEQAMQEACLQLLLRDGIPCEACCMGNSANHVLRHYVLPDTADAPLAEELDTTEKIAATAAVHYMVKTPPPTPHNEGAASAKRGNKGNASDTPLATPSPSPAAHNSHARPGAVKSASCTTRFGRLRLVRIPRRANSYVLEFVYTHQGLPMPPRMQAALTGRPEESLTSTPRKTNLEQMVDALPSVHGVAGRGGTRTQGPLKEHRLFAIPLHEPSLHLHLHVLEEGIPDMATPVAATSDAPADATDTMLTDSSRAGLPAASSHLCVARRFEAGSQIVLEVQGLPYTTSTRRPLVVAAAATETKTKSQSSSKKQQKAADAARKSSKQTAAAGNDNEGRNYSQLYTGTSRGASKASTAAHASAEPLPLPAPPTAGWSDLVLAKRLSGGGELMLPSSCILANKGCCSLVLRFPHPFFTSMTRTEGIEAIVGALCGILRPALTVPEVRLSAPSTRSPSKKSAAARRRSSTSPGVTSVGADRDRTRSSSNSGRGHTRRRSSVSHSPLQDDGNRAVELEVMTYAHVPYTMFAAETPTAGRGEGIAASSAVRVERSASSSAVAGRAAQAPSSSHSASMARSDSLDGLMGPGGGMLGHTLQSSCSAAHEKRATAAATAAGAMPATPVRTPRGSTATVTAEPAAEPQNGATLQVQFHWISTPPDVEPPPRGGTNMKSSGTPHTSFGEPDRSEEAQKELPRAPHRDNGVHGFGHSPRRRADEGVRQQLRSALGVLAHLSYVFVEGRPSSSAFTTAESSLADFQPREHHGHTRGGTTGGLAQHLTPSGGTHASRYKDAVAVAALLRQLDTYRQRIRRLFRQQLYDAEDVLGDEVQLGGPERGAHVRMVQAEVKRAIGLPSGMLGHTMTDDGASFSVDGSPARLGVTDNGRRGANTSGGGARGTHALLSLASGESGPDTQVTIPEAREACGATVPWSIWQWAYRWSRLRHLLLHPLQHAPNHAPVVTPSGGGSIAKVDAPAAWLPVDEWVSETSVAAHAGHVLAAPASLPEATSARYASSSSSSSEGYAMEGDWLSEARLAARPKRVWLPDVLSSTIPSYLESCAADYAT